MTRQVAANVPNVTRAREKKGKRGKASSLHTHASDVRDVPGSGAAPEGIRPGVGDGPGQQP